MSFDKPSRTRKQERASSKRQDAKVQHLARIIVFQEDQRCRFPWDATSEFPCSGPLELCHMKPRTKAETVNKPPEYRHDPRYMVMMCDGHHQGPYSYDGSIGGRGFTMEPLDNLKMFRGPCTFTDKDSGEILGIN